MPTTVRHIHEVRPDTRINRRTGKAFRVWVIIPTPDDDLSAQESLAAFETVNHWIASLCDAARVKGLAVEILWRETAWLRDIVEARLLEKERVA